MERKKKEKQMEVTRGVVRSEQLHPTWFAVAWVSSFPTTTTTTTTKSDTSRHCGALSIYLSFTLTFPHSDSVLEITFILSLPFQVPAHLERQTHFTLLLGSQEINLIVSKIKKGYFILCFMLYNTAHGR